MVNCIGSLFVAAISLTFANALLPAPQGDPNSVNKYTIDYVSSCRWDSLLEADNGTVINFGSDTQCLIPDPHKTDDTNTGTENAQDMQALMAETLDLSVQILSSTLDGYCFLYINGFWTYRYCPGNDIIQLHNDTSDPQTLIYTLAKSKPNVEDREFQLLFDDVGYYVSEIVGMGDICDVTGAPRLVEVQYVCADVHGGATILWIRETKTCQYELQIAVPQLCALELLSKNEDKKNAIHLECLKSEKEQQKNQGNVIDTLAEYDPIFLGYGIYFLQPINKDHRDVLMYSGELDVANITQDTFDMFGKAFNRLINQRMLIAPSGEHVVTGDVFNWMSKIVDLQGREITMMSIYVSKNGKANIYMNNEMSFSGPDNFSLFQSKKDSVMTLAENEKDVVETNTSAINENDTEENGARFVIKLAEGKEIGVSVRLHDGKQYISLVALQEGANFELLNEYDRQRILDFVFESDEVKSILGDIDVESFQLEAARYDDTVLFEYTSPDLHSEEREQAANMEDRTEDLQVSDDDRAVFDAADGDLAAEFEDTVASHIVITQTETVTATVFSEDKVPTDIAVEATTEANIEPIIEVTEDEDVIMVQPPSINVDSQANFHADETLNHENDDLVVHDEL